MEQNLLDCRYHDDSWALSCQSVVAYRISAVLPLFDVLLSTGEKPNWALSYILWFQGAKNHGVVMPDANKENTLNQLVGAAFGAAGQRCMALSTAIFVGESREWLPELVQRSKSLRVNAGDFSSALVSSGKKFFFLLF